MKQQNNSTEALLTSQHKQLEQLCNNIDADNAIPEIITGLKSIFPEYGFECVLTRGNWHRLGGVVDANYNRVTDNIANWVEQESAGKLEDFIIRYLDAGYFATSHAGKTHYFTASCGDKAEDFIQLEIEELKEVLDRRLIDPDWFPDNLEDFLDPLDYPRLKPEIITAPRFIFRRMTSINQLIAQFAQQDKPGEHVRQFLADWNNSSAGSNQTFCKHWILSLREYMGSDGEAHLTAKPITIFTAALPQLPNAEKYHGVELANAIHHYDRHMNYPFSWYFMMISKQSENYTLADAVMQDLKDAYDYLPVKDLNILKNWIIRPFAV